MAIGSERSLLIDNRFKRAIVAVVGDTHFGRVLRFFYFKQALDKLPFYPGSILDAGCGKGYLSIYLARRYPNARVVGMDLGRADLVEAECIRQAAHLNNLAFVHGDVQRPIGVNAFDLIVSSEVLEYVPDETAALKHLNQALRPGGILLLHLMHAEGGYRQLGARRLFKTQPGQWRDTGMVRAGYTERDLEAQLKHVGFTDIALEPTFGVIGMFAHSWFEVGRTWPAPLYFLLFPLLVLLGHCDVRARKVHGGALLATGRKS